MNQSNFNAPSPVAAPVTVYSQLQAEIAPPQFLPLSPFPSSLPLPPPGLLRRKKDAITKPANGEELPENSIDTKPSTVIVASHNSNEGFLREKNDAHTNPPNEVRVELQENSTDKSNEGSYKNLLQEYAQKKGLLCPSYKTVSSGMSHNPIFVSVVAIERETFQGDECKTKKQAEMNAAKVAYVALTKVTDLPSERVETSLEILEKHPVQLWKTVVIPQELSIKIPKHAIVKPYSNGQWVEFKVGLDIEVAV